MPKRAAITISLAKPRIVLKAKAPITIPAALKAFSLLKTGNLL
jgi:hypothetical protein